MLEYFLKDCFGIIKDTGVINIIRAVFTQLKYKICKLIGQNKFTGTKRVLLADAAEIMFTK